ncbi:MAG: EpsG family protein [Oscillospiraceae bacterium]|nr:EpsG family protein [Oscillospiraceae bacterium]
MGVFFALLFIPIIIQHTAIKNHYVSYEKKNRRALAFFFLLLTVLVMFRHETIGNDTSNYMSYYEIFSNLSWSETGKVSMERGFAYLNKFLSLFSKEPQFFIAASAVTVSTMIYPTYKRLCLDSFLTIVLFCLMSTFVMMFSGVRQMLAVAIGFIAYEFTRNRKTIPFVLTVFLAMAFHSSAFMLFFMYPIYHAKITKKWIFLVVPAIATVFVFNEPIFTLLLFIMERYTRFSGEISPTGAYTMIILFVVFAIFSFLIPDESKLDKETIGLRNFLLFSVIIQLFAPLHTIAMRMNYYYIIFIPLLIPKIIEARSNRWNQVAKVARHVMAVFFLVYFFYNAYTAENNLNVFPYKFFWET